MELHDIFPEVPIVEYSLYSFIAMGLLGLILLSIFYLLWIRRRKKIQPLHILEHYNPNDAKQTTHQVSYYGKKLAKSVTQKQHLATLEKKLDKYKYLHTSEVLTKALEDEIEIFIQVLKGKDV